MKFRRNIGGSSAKPQLDIYNIKDNPEWQLAESYVAEFTDITGIKVEYFIRDMVNIKPDPLYGETQDAEYLEGRMTRLLYEVGDIPTLYSMFGMMTTDQIICHIPQCIYWRDVSKTTLPKPGDVIKIEWYRGMFIPDGVSDLSSGPRTFEISHVAQDEVIFQLHSLVYVLYLIPYRFSEESDSARDISSSLSTSLSGIASFGDNEYISTQSEALSAYTGIDTSVYGY